MTERMSARELREIEIGVRAALYEEAEAQGFGTLDGLIALERLRKAGSRLRMRAGDYGPEADRH